MLFKTDEKDLRQAKSFFPNFFPANRVFLRPQARHSLFRVAAESSAAALPIERASNLTQLTSSSSRLIPDFNSPLSDFLFRPRYSWKCVAATACALQTLAAGFVFVVVLVYEGCFGGCEVIEAKRT
ncbi:hypothetical protein L596_006973 [Steinernema carpocapsae]|uniref:Uncharacterized protein n=1 Tax=Steinernema carpocapsae TaxID=34508 RepID=A0A4U5P890_STECR|nr:hypothetical protein L596_006973 [Steinernema carpocapsae]